MSLLLLNEVSIASYGDEIVIYVSHTGQTHLLDAVVVELFDLLTSFPNISTNTLIIRLLNLEDNSYHKKELLIKYFNDIIESLINIEVIKKTSES